MTLVKPSRDAISVGDTCHAVLCGHLDNCHGRCSVWPMPYTPMSREPETDWARHLDAIRREKGWSATELFRQVRVKLALGENSRSTFVAGLHRDPKPHWKSGLIELFGEPPKTAPEPTTATETPDLLVAALTAQTEALLDLVGELRLWRIEDRAQLGQVQATVDQLVAAALAGQGRPGPVEHALPAESGE